MRTFALAVANPLLLIIWQTILLQNREGREDMEGRSRPTPKMFVSGARVVSDPVCAPTRSLEVVALVDGSVSAEGLVRKARTFLPSLFKELAATWQLSARRRRGALTQPKPFVAGGMVNFCDRRVGGRTPDSEAGEYCVRWTHNSLGTAPEHWSEHAQSLKADCPETKASTISPLPPSAGSSDAKSNGGTKGGEDGDSDKDRGKDKDKDEGRKGDREEEEDVLTAMVLSSVMFTPMESEHKGVKGHSSVSDGKPTGAPERAEWDKSGTHGDVHPIRIYLVLAESPTHAGQGDATRMSRMLEKTKQGQQSSSALEDLCTRKKAYPTFSSVGEFLRKQEIYPIVYVHADRGSPVPDLWKNEYADHMGYQRSPDTPSSGARRLYQAVTFDTSLNSTVEITKFMTTTFLSFYCGVQARLEEEARGATKPSGPALTTVIFSILGCLGGLMALVGIAFLCVHVRSTKLELELLQHPSQEREAAPNEVPSPGANT